MASYTWIVSNKLYAQISGDYILQKKEKNMNFTHIEVVELLIISSWNIEKLEDFERCNFSCIISFKSFIHTKKQV